MRTPKWYWPWVQWRLGEGAYKGMGPKGGKRPATPRRISPWAWARLAAFMARRKLKMKPKPPVRLYDHTLPFWRRMGVWITRIDHAPTTYIQAYGKGKYGYVIVPCVFGLMMEVGDTALREYIRDLKALGFHVVGSQWGAAETVAAAEAEAEVGAEMVRRYGFDGWVMNGEKKYEGGGKSAAYARRFRQHHPNLPFGWSPEPRISLDHGVLQELGVCYMPQAYPLENGKDVMYVVSWGAEFGYEYENIVPLIQAYPNGAGTRYAAAAYASHARAYGLRGLVLYTGNQAFDVPQYWMDLVV